MWSWGDGRQVEEASRSEQMLGVVALKHSGAAEVPVPPQADQSSGAGAHQEKRVAPYDAIAHVELHESKQFVGGLVEALRRSRVAFPV